MDNLERAMVEAARVLGDGWRRLSVEERLEGLARCRFGDFGLTVEERMNALELAHRRLLVHERVSSLMLAAFASGWDEAVSGFVCEAAGRVLDDWEGRLTGAARPSLVEVVDTLGRVAASLAGALAAVVPLIKAVNGRRSADAECAEAGRKAAEFERDRLVALLDRVMPKVGALADRAVADAREKVKREAQSRYALVHRGVRRQDKRFGK